MRAFVKQGRTLVGMAGLLAAVAASAQEAPEPAQTISEDLRISTQTPHLELHETNTLPPRSFHVEVRQDGLEIRDGVQGLAPAIHIRHFYLAGGGELTLRGYPISLWGNVGINGSASYPFHVRGLQNDSRPLLVVDDGNSTAASRNLLRLRNRGASTFRFENLETGLNWGFGSLSSGSFFLSASGQPGLGLTLSPGGDLQIAGTLTQGSSREIKDDIAAVQPREVLERLRALPISTWRYKHAPESLHMGPMAQDFAAAFGLGSDPGRLAPADLAAVSLAGVQALQAEVQALRAELRGLQAARSCAGE